MFSVIIPLYNKEHTIERTLKSVFAQTFQIFEIIVVDDGSTDRGIDVINILTNDPRLRIIKQKNQGVSVARNFGVLEAKYNYIAFLDGDDEWLPEYLQTVSEAIKMYPDSGMICCAGYFKNDKKHTTNLRIAKKYKNSIVEINYFENPHVFTHTSATVVSKHSFYMTSGFPVGMKKNEDFALFYSVALLRPTVYCGIPLACYHVDIEGQSTTINQLNSDETNLDVCERLNMTYKLWNSLGRKNKTFKVFLKYELRHTFLSALRKKDFKKIDLHLNKLDKDLLGLFPGFELSLYRKKTLLELALIYIFATKLAWRLRGYPRVGET